MLRGIAISVPHEGVGSQGTAVTGGEGRVGEVFWKYLPVESLPLDAAEGIAELFRIKPRWTRDELEPYAARYVKDESSCAGAPKLDLLLRYTKVVEEIVASVPVSHYVLR
jgi:hypothetical protein